MIGLSWTEMLIIGVVALIFIGPKELPAMMQRLGKAVGTIRRMGGEFQRELNRSTGLDQVTDLRRSITEPLRKTGAEIAREFNKATATGTEPTGVIKPADPKAESVVAEIQAAAGKTAAAPLATPAPNPTDAMKAAVTGALAKDAPLKTGPAQAATPAAAAPTPQARTPARRKSAAAKPASAKAASAEAASSGTTAGPARPKSGKGGPANGAEKAARPARRAAAKPKAAPKSAPAGTPPAADPSAGMPPAVDTPDRKA